MLTKLEYKNFIMNYTSQKWSKIKSLVDKICEILSTEIQLRTWNSTCCPKNSPEKLCLESINEIRQYMEHFLYYGTITTRGSEEIPIINMSVLLFFSWIFVFNNYNLNFRIWFNKKLPLAFFSNLVEIVNMLLLCT